MPKSDTAPNPVSRLRSDNRATFHSPASPMSATFTLQRGPSSDEGTFGALIGPDGVVCRTLEPPDRDNAPNVSCIPEGEYPVAYLARSASGRYRDVYHVKDVEGRSGILIHAGNFGGDRSCGHRSHTYGCILPGLRLGILAEQRAVLASRAALQRLHATTERADFALVVRAPC